MTASEKLSTCWRGGRQGLLRAGTTVALAICGLQVGAWGVEPAASPAKVLSARTAEKAEAVKPAHSAVKAADDEENPFVWKPRTRAVAVFKNGLGFFMREGEVKLRDGWCVAEHVPPAAFGTLAIYACSQKETVDVVGSGPGDVVEFDGRDAPKDVAAKKARLEQTLSTGKVRCEIGLQQYL